MGGSVVIIGGGSLLRIGSALVVLASMTLHGCETSGADVDKVLMYGSRVCMPAGVEDGKSCAGTCMNNNTAYSTKAKAETACVENPECTMILEWLDGTYFLRREADRAEGGYPGKTHMYKCTGGDGKTADVAPSDGELIGGTQDEHGCLTSAGFRWCEPANACIGPGADCAAKEPEDDNHGCHEDDEWCESANACMPRGKCADEDIDEANSMPDADGPRVIGKCDLHDVIQSSVPLPFSLETESMSTECCNKFHEVAALDQAHNPKTGARMKGLYKTICEDLKCPEMVQETSLKDILQLACTYGEAGEPVEPAALLAAAKHTRRPVLRHAQRVN